MITYEFAWFLPHVLRNVEEVADEIVVVDGFSKDGTAELLRTHPKVRFHQQEFVNFGAQKNAVFELAKGDWILSIDQDEMIGDWLREDLPSLIANRRLTHYKLPRYWLIAGPPWRYIETEKLYPDWGMRLFRNEPRFRYGPDQIVHHHFPREGRGPKRRVRRGHLFHFDFMLRDREARAVKYDQYVRLDPTREPTHRMYLFEQVDFRGRACREPLTVPGLTDPLWWRKAGKVPTVGSDA
jgi:glycosyltransferase involved in cell wall biosynthesis